MILYTKIAVDTFGLVEKHM